MGVKTAHLRLADDGLRFEATSGSGHTIVLDDSDRDGGMRPAELLGVALASCTGMDVISILRKKRQAVTGYEIRVEGHQMPARPHAFVRFDVLHVVEGSGIDAEAVRRSVELSATKYCSVGSTLASGMLEIHHRYTLRDADGSERSGDVVICGPQWPPDRPVEELLAAREPEREAS
jgi:putative redox protein